MNQPRSDASSEKKKEASSTWSALGFAWELGYVIAVPIVALALLGRLVDKYFSTAPWFLLVGIGLSIVISSVAVYFKAVKVLKD